MKIYHCVESYFPSVGGMQEVVRQLSERMAKAGHEVYVLTRHHPERKSNEWNGVRIVDFKIDGNPFIATTEEEIRYVNYLLSIEGDIVSFFAAQQWATNLALDILKVIRAKKISVPTGYSGLYKPEYKSYFHKMKEWIHGYDMNVYLSDDYRDINFARECGVDKIMLIPNGASEEEFLEYKGPDIRKKFNIPAHHKILLHVGSYTGRKGHRECLELFLRTNLKNTTLLLIGKGISYFFRRSIFKYPILLSRIFFSSFSSKKIVFIEADRLTTVAAYFQSDIFLFPSQVECSPIVLFESSAAGLPFFTTDAGNAREIVKWTEGGEIMETRMNEEGFAVPEYETAVRQLENFMNDGERLKQYSLSGRIAWKHSFTWEQISSRYLELYTKLLS